MIYATIDSSNKITGIFASPQPDLDGYAEISGDDSRIADFNAQMAALMAAPPTPTLEQLQAQANALLAQIQAMQAKG